MRKPTVPLPSTVARAFVELAIIVAGVLIALGAQSWWEQRQLDDERTRVQQGVTADLDALLVHLEERTARSDSILADIRWLLLYAPSYSQLPDSVFNRRITWALWEIAGTDPRLPAYEDLKGSGRLELLSADARIAMTQLDQAMARLIGTDDDVFQYQIRNLDPWLLDNAPLRSMLSYQQDDREVFQDTSERFPASALTSRRVENMMLAKRELTVNLQEAITRVAHLARRARSALGSAEDGES